MTPDAYRRVGQLYHAALELAPECRAAFLDEACGNDDAIRREVESLLTAHERAREFIATPALEVAAEMLTAQMSSSIIGRTISHYRVLSFLGAGGMGEVYLAEDARLGRKVALKLLPSALCRDQERVRRFEREARAASALNHPNIITIYDIGNDEAGHFIVMELIEGSTLRTLIAEGIRDKLVHFGVQMAKALRVAHAADITHRDIKPENIMVRQDGYLKVLDFGLARLVTGIEAGSDAIERSATQPGLLIGTVCYMSPEQARGESAVPPSDVFSLGLIFYEIATGRHPFTADSLLGTLNSINSQVPAPPSCFNPDLSPSFETLILSMLEKDTRLRPTAAEVEAALTETSQRSRVEGHSTPQTRRTVGREKEHTQLRTGFAGAVSGRGLMVGVAGEPGIGKTTLVEDFLSELSASGQFCFVARGRCSERLAGTEAYLPWFEALESLLRSDGSMKSDDAPIAQTMRQLAPSWYAQVASSGPDNSSTERASSQERMKRELRALLQAVSGQRPIVLFLDDLHWADVSTIDLLGFLADRLSGMRILIIGAYRPSDLLLARHPFLQLKPDLQARGVCREIALEFLSRENIERFLALEFPGHRFPNELLALIYAKTEGSPLFVADLVRYLRHRGVIAQEDGQWVLSGSLLEIERELPESVRGMIERKIAQLTEEDRRLLVVASVQGYEFDSAIVASVLALDAAIVEERLEELERVHAFVRQVEERMFPDRTLTLRYRFIHVLYQNALYASLRPTRRLQLSAAVARALEGYWGERSASVANELAVLYEAARDFGKAAECFQLAAQNANHVFASQEAVQLAHRGLAMVDMLPDGRGRIELELALQVVLGNTLIATRGYAAPEVEQAYSRANDLCLQLGEISHRLPVLCGLCFYHNTRSNLRKALELGEEFLRLAERQNDPAIVVAHRMMGNPLFFLGELTRAREHYEEVVSIYTADEHRSLAWLYGAEPGMNGRVLLAMVLWLLGYPDLALRRNQEALRLGREVSHANSHAYALCYGSTLYQFRREPGPIREQAEQLIALSTEQGLAMWLGHGVTQRGWTMVQQGELAKGIEQMRRGMDAVETTGAQLWRHFELCLLAEACGKAQRAAEGLTILDEAQALVEKNEGRLWEAELHRVRGDLLLMEGAPTSEVGSCFQKAIEVARRQQAKSLELRAVMSLSRLWQRQGKQREAREMLAGVYGWFTEGFDTPDLKEATTLLDDLNRR